MDQRNRLISVPKTMTILIMSSKINVFTKIKCVAFLFLALPIFSIAQDTWKHKKSEDGIEVYYRKSDTSKVNELRVETTIDASIISLVAALRDIPAYTEWVMNCTMAEKLEAESMVKTCYYSQVDFPWPLTDRDFIARNNLYQDSTTKIVYSELTGVPDMLPEEKGFVRIQHLKIKWKLTPLTPNKVKVDYLFQSDPGGNLPGWMINLAIDKGPVSSLKKLKEMVKKEKYQTAVVPNIENIIYSDRVSKE